jgi:hypothetical protein
MRMLGALALMAALPHTVAAEPVSFSFTGRVTLVSGAPFVVDHFEQLGVAVDAPLHGEIVFESSTPPSPSSPGFYRGAILRARMQTGDWGVQGPTAVSRVNSIGVSLTSYSLAVAVHDEPDVIPSDNATTVMSMVFSRVDPPAFESTDLPVEPPDPSLFDFAWGRVLGGGGAAGRVQVAFEVERLVRVPDRLEGIVGIQIRRRGIVFQVRSSGCTDKSDFQVDVFEGSVLNVALIRTRPDLCRAVEPLGTRVFFSYRELGLEPTEEFVVINPRAPVLVPEGPGPRQDRQGH